MNNFYFPFSFGLTLVKVVAFVYCSFEKVLDCGFGVFPFESNDYGNSHAFSPSHRHLFVSNVVPKMAYHNVRSFKKVSSTRMSSVKFEI